MALCSRHHRFHHRGELGITGNADDPDGVVFTDARGRPLERCGTPTPPTGALPTGNWSHPTGERLDDRWVDFSPPPGMAAAGAAAALARPVRVVDQPVADYPPCIKLDDPIYGVQDDDDAWSA